MDCCTACAWSMIIIAFQLKSSYCVQPRILPEADSTAAKRTTSHFACECPSGFFSKGTLSIFTAAAICQSQLRETAMEINIKPDMDPNKIVDSAKLIPVTMEICHSCATGCALCLGPDDNDCLKCLRGYMINYYQDAAKGSGSSSQSGLVTRPAEGRTKRTSSKRGWPRKRNLEDKQIYEREELLLREASATSAGRSSRRMPLADILKVDTESLAYVDDNFMSLEAADDGFSGYAETRATKGSKNVKDHVLDESILKDNVLDEPILQDSDKLTEDDDENIETDLHEQKQQQSLVSSPNASDAFVTAVTSPEAIQWHGSSPFSCVLACPENFYADEDRICQACHGECLGCHGNGPEHCHRCRHFYEDGQCVATCRFTEQMANENDASGSNCTSTQLSPPPPNERQQLRGQTADRQQIAITIPLGYYVLPPLILLAVIAFVVLGHFRKRYRMQLNWSSCTAAGRRASANTDRHHEDHIKCFLNRNKNHLPKTSHLKLSSSSLSSPDRKCASGNAYISTMDRSLLSPNKDTLSEGSTSPTRPSSKGIVDDDVYETDPLYETPDSTCNSRGHGDRGHRFRRRRQSSISTTQCYLIPVPSSTLTTLEKPEPNAEQDCCCPKVTSSEAVESSRTSSPPCNKKMSTNENGFEVPGFEAPRLPSRNSPILEPMTSDDHIYVNIDDVPSKRIETY